MRCFVTGGAGTIGLALTVALKRMGCDVTVYDVRPVGSGALPPDVGVRSIQGDLNDRQPLTAALANHDVVFHLAGYIDTHTNDVDSDADLRDGVVATRCLLAAMRAAAVKRLVFASSQLVYGFAHTPPIPETAGPLLPTSLYAASKIAAEASIAACSSLFGIESTICRMCTVLSDRADRGIVHDFVTRLARGSRDLEIWSDGDDQRSYLLVDDCVTGLLSAWREARRGPADVFNIGNVDALASTDVARIVLEESGLAAAVVVAGPSPSRAPSPAGARLVLDVTKLMGCGWTPRWTSEAAVRECARKMYARQAAASAMSASIPPPR